MRQRRAYGVIGMPGAGKSTYIVRMLKKYSGNVLVYKSEMNIKDPAFKDFPLVAIDKYRGGKAMISDYNIAYKDFLNWIWNNYRNGCVLIDDATLYEKYMLSEKMVDLLTMRRHLGLDMIMAYHGCTYFPIQNYPFINTIILFHTADNFQYKGSKIPHAKHLEECQKRMSDKYNKYPDRHPKRYEPEIIQLS